MLLIQKILFWDRFVFYFINKHLYYPLIFTFFELITNAVDIIILFLVIYWLSSRFFLKKHSSIQKLTNILIPVFITALITVILKIIIQRGSPTTFVIPWSEISLPFLPYNYAFPSGHTGRAFALAAALATIYPKKSIPLFLIAALIGFSRVYVGSHYPLDVIFGALLGVTISLLYLKLFMAKKAIMSPRPEPELNK